MKTSSWTASAAATVVVVGGGIWGVNVLTDEPDTESAPVVTETPAASAEPVETVEPVESPGADPLESPEAVEPTPSVDLSEGEAELVWLTQTQLLADLELSEAEILEAAEFVCNAPAGTNYDTLELRGADDDDLLQFWVDAEYHAC